MITHLNFTMKSWKFGVVFKRFVADIIRISREDGSTANLETSYLSSIHLTVDTVQHIGIIRTENIRQICFRKIFRRVIISFCHFKIFVSYNVAKRSVF